MRYKFSTKNIRQHPAYGVLTLWKPSDTHWMNGFKFENVIELLELIKTISVGIFRVDALHILTQYVWRPNVDKPGWGGGFTLKIEQRFFLSLCHHIYYLWVIRMAKRVKACNAFHAFEMLLPAKGKKIETWTHFRWKDKQSYNLSTHSYDDAGSCAFFFVRVVAIGN